MQISKDNKVFAKILSADNKSTQHSGRLDICAGAWLVDKKNKSRIHLSRFITLFHFYAQVQF